MTDNKQEAKNKFAELVKVDIDNMFSKDLTENEVDVAIAQEIGNILKDVTAINNISAKQIEDDTQTLVRLSAAEKEVVDLKRQLEIREELDIAA